MLYRRKILLALVELCGGFVKVAECQAYLAQFCKRKGKNYYDFFPSLYGCYSLVLAYDKHHLTDQGHFAVQEAFHFAQKQTYLDELRSGDRQLLQTIIAESISDQCLNLFTNHFYTEKEALAEWGRNNQPTKEQSPNGPCLFTLGYEGLSIDSYLSLLIAHHITLLVDVRKNPFSRKYGFSKKHLLQATALAGIEYRHLPTLGVPSDMRQHLDTEAAYKTLFEYYAQHILPGQLDTVEQIKDSLAKAGRAVLTCFEADPQFCHRHIITEYLLQSDSAFHTPIIHLMAERTINANNTNHSKRKNVPGQESQNSIYIPI